MKRFSIIYAVIILFSVVFPIFYTLKSSKSRGAPLTDNEGQADASVAVSVLDGDNIVEMNLSDYLTGVVAAEMPASFEEEALKAQAVAARTYTLYKMVVAPSSNHPDADVCTNSACCKAYISQDTMKERWGDNYDQYYDKISQSVSQTDGQCLVYDSEPILAVFHSSSSGMTESSGDIWPNQLPYLVSVESPETADSVPNFSQTVKVSYDDFKNTVMSQYPDAVFSDDKSTWITDIVLNDSGRIATAVIGGITMTGPDIRSLFSLRSSSITFNQTETEIEITTEGYGHGVGMSQYGANTMAQSGSNYKDILSWYYTGCQFGSVSDFI